MNIMPRIYEELQALGITANYRGRNQAAKAIQLALEDESRLDHVTKEIYWEVAEFVGCNRSDVERNLRTVAQRAWSVSRDYLTAIAHYHLPAAPTASELIAIVAFHIRQTDLPSSSGQQSLS